MGMLKQQNMKTEMGKRQIENTSKREHGGNMQIPKI